MSGINSFNTFINDHRLIKSLPLSSLQNSCLAIEGEYFVSQVLGVSKGKDDNGHREPLVHAVGGFPYSLEERIRKFIKLLQINKIDPLFVFNGLDLVLLKPSLNDKKRQVDNRNNGWNLYEKGQGEQAVLLFDEIEPFDLHLPGFGLRKVFDILVDLDVKYIHAPYTATAQIGYLMQEGYVDSVYGSNECFLYPAVETLITSINEGVGSVPSSAVNSNPNSNPNSGNGTPKQTTPGTPSTPITISNPSIFQFITKKSVLNELNFVNNEQFVEAAIACGCSLTNHVSFNTIDQIISSNPRTTALRAAQEINQANGSIYNAIIVYDNTNNDNYLERFQKSLASIEFQPVLKDDGKVESFQNIANIPNDQHEYIGQRLPDEIFFYFSKGLIGSELLNAVTSGVSIEYSPLDGGDSKEYQEFLIKQQKEFKNKAFNILIGCLHRYYQFKPVNERFWFDNKDYKYERINPPLYFGLIPSLVKLVEGEQLKIEEPINLAKILENLNTISDSAPSTATSTHTTTPKPLTPLQKDSNIIIISLLASLKISGFISNDNKLTKWGKALLSGLKSVTPDLYEPLIILSTLVKNGYVNSKPFTGTDSSKSTNPNTLLISRVACHINLNHNPIGYTGPLSRSLLSYQSFISKQIQNYRLLTETIITSIFTNGHAERLNRTDKQWYQLVKQLPFTNVPNVGAGIATQTYLDEVISNGGDIQKAKNSFKPMFKQAIDVVEDVSTAFKLWDGIFTFTTEIKDDIKDYQTFVEANKLLSNNRF